MKDSLVTSSSRAQTGTTCKMVSARISSRFEKKCNNQMNNDIIIIAVIYKVRKTEKVRKKLKKLILEPHWTHLKLLKFKDVHASLKRLAPKKLFNGALFEINEQQCLMLACFFNTANEHFVCFYNFLNTSSDPTNL